MVDSCMNCACCAEGDENMCQKSYTSTYNGKCEHGNVQTDAGYTFGGYSSRHTVHERFTVKVSNYRRYEQ